MGQKFNYRREEYRGTLKQIMKVRGLRTISLNNFNNWKITQDIPVVNHSVHSLKLDIQDGYINAYKFNSNNTDKCGTKYEDAPEDIYAMVYNEVNELLQYEKFIPSKVKRNILVKVSR